MKRVGGTISFKVDGEIHSAKGDFTYNLGKGKREPVIGSDGVHGYKETPQAPYIKGAITDHKDLNLEEVMTMENVTAVLDLANGKTIVLRDAFNGSDGEASTGEGEIPIELFGSSCQEIR